MNAKVFGMVSTALSREYTKLALHTFFENTELCAIDRFYLIDNDDALNEIPDPYPQVTVVKNSSPRSFAANVNQIIEIARKDKQDLYFLNNDLVFSPNWLPPLEVRDPQLLCAVSNREFQYATPQMNCERSLTLADYHGRERDFLQIVRHHREKMSGYLRVLTLPFFCVKIPYEVYNTVGLLDEGFGRGGGEDGDYCLRAAIAGFSTAYALDSYLLHFNGKSTWAVETKEQEEERCQRFRKRFVEKWGEDLTALIVGYETNILQKYGGFEQELRRGDFRAIIERMRAQDTQ